MQCTDIQKKLSAYIDGQLSHEEKLQTEGHLKTCADCGRVFEDLKKTVTHLQGLEEVEPPPWLEQKVMARVREEAEQKRGILRKLFFPLHVKIPAEVFAALAVAVTAFYIFRTVEPEIKAPVQTVDKQVEAEREADKAVPGKEEPGGIPLLQGRDRKAAYPADIEAQPPQTLKSEAPPLITESAAKREVREETTDLFEGERGPVRRYRATGIKKENIAPAPAAGFQASVQEAGFSVYVKDIHTALEKIEAAVNDTGGEITGTEVFEDIIIITAKIKAGQVNGLLEKAELIGEVDKKPMLYKLRGDAVITIEVLQQSASPQQ